MVMTKSASMHARPDMLGEEGMEEESVATSSPPTTHRGFPQRQSENKRQNSATPNRHSR